MARRSPWRSRLLVLGVMFGVALGVLWLRFKPVPAKPGKLTLRELIAPPKHGELVIEIRDPEGRPIPARATFVGVRGTKNPLFSRSDVGIELSSGVLAYDRAFLLGGATLSVPAGSYEVWFTYGMEWEEVSRVVHIHDKKRSKLSITLRHSVPTPGWISGDFHVHAERSPDSRVAMSHRLWQFIADGVDLIVSADHNAIADYQPVIDKLGVGRWIASIRGNEVTTNDWGHFGAFPLPADIGTPDTAPVPTKDRTPAQIFNDLHERSSDTLIDIHHPRLYNGYFHLTDVDPATMRGGRDGFALGFDAIEVLNGYQDPALDGIDAVLVDWYALLRRGYRITGTGNSDTHHMTFNLGGYPRNYVQTESSDPASVAEAVRAGRCYFTTGPIVEVSADGKGLGETVTAKGTPLSLHVRVRAPSWIDVDRVTVYVDGEEMVVLPARGHEAVRFDEIIEVPTPHDTFVTVRVDGDRAMEPMIGDGEKFLVYPLAITNPIWVDADGDGVVTPSVAR